MSYIIRKKWQLDRRTFLRGVGVTLGLPMLEAMVPTALAAPASASGPTRRFVAINFPNGVNPVTWHPADDGIGYKMPMALSPLEALREDISVFTGLWHHLRVGATGHAGLDSFLTGSSLKGTSNNYVNSVSLDQVLAEKIGRNTRHASIELSTSGKSDLGGSGSPYHSNTLAFNRGGIPLPALNKHSQIFEKLFLEGPVRDQEIRAKALEMDGSILDAVMGQAKGLSRNLGTHDRDKLDEYLSSIEGMEGRLKRAGEWLGTPKPTTDEKIDRFNQPQNDGYVKMQLMAELIFLALQSDSTRVVTLTLGNEANGNAFLLKGKKYVTHPLSHHSFDEENLAMQSELNRAFVEVFSGFLAKLKAEKESDVPMLDNTAVLFGSGMSMAHRCQNLPLILAGGKGLGLKHGAHHDFSKEGERWNVGGKEDSEFGQLKLDENSPPLSNLYLTLLRQYGLEDERFADSTGLLPQLVT